MGREMLRDLLGKRVLVCDGAMGTQLMARGMVPGECGETWNVERGADVGAIHAAYVAAGCELITTNTFGATRTMLERHGMGGRVAELAAAGVKVAREAAGDRAWVLGDVGPFGDFLEPMGDVTETELTAIFTEQIAAMHAAGADGAIVETMADPGELAVAVKAARAVGGKGWPVVATFSFGRGADGVFRTMMGTSAAEAVKAAVAAGADVVGTNCGSGLGLAEYRLLAGELLAAAGGVPVIVQPNAGAPVVEGGKTVYRATEGEMAELAVALRGMGVKVIGGCCGTGPGVLRAMAGVVRG